ncbi:MAG: type IX secretion system membrane protein PorP/SprF [Flavobacteriales bacterium]|jgi:type IX secretion system PorP/SprF family membrane protein|nr:type IX secretion system membrane protein PorP/SprF [Flavobacteriales bacterium]MBK6549871.1 type IX secretion system membrane protein PorP/SprF [Flavobacteriales bacterium]MBK6881964.1 type IX secretion system membrane protein PorP/SprF [Flavobacteriales bacterium]MBK7102382.1 type IX secretion system membrane protein PorP/SprF [Flavobacteriales bacterium]MBK7113122.1 type IX secretion system membrane protein PorP/SprF [Flavobacteriales bacterium]
MRGILTAVVGMVVASASFAQQDPQLTQYMFDRLSVNPAVAGTNGQLCVTGFFRQQWSGFEGAPKTGLLNAQMPIAKISSGVGLSVYFDELGQQKSNFARLSYSFHRKIGPGTFGVGLSAGLLAHSLGSNWIARDNPADDAAIPGNGQSDSKFDLGAGLYYTSPTFYIGISSTHLTEPELKDVSIKGVRHYWVQAGYDWAIGGDKKYVLQPSTLIKSDGTSTQVDLTATFLYNNQVWLGVSYRTEDAIAPLIGYQIATGKDKTSMFKIGYSYDVTTSRLKNYSSGSHEIMLNYCMLLVKKPDLQIYKNVRFL